MGRPDLATADEKPCDLVRTAEAALDQIEMLHEELAREELSDHGSRVPEFPPEFLLSVVIPIYNERATLVRLIGSVVSLPVPLEIIAVDDGSTDGSRELLEQLKEQHPRLQVILQERNQGKGSALRRGFAESRGSHVIVQDADLEYNPRDIPALLLPLMDDEADVVYGSRFLGDHRTGSSWVHRFGNWGLTMLSNRATGLRLTDMETCYKLFRRDLLDNIHLEQNGFGFEVELTSKLARQGARFVERPISYNARKWGEGKKIGWRDALVAVYCICKYRG
jgi:glycosyltransferase involved in cell wall biosynthesis